MVMSGRQVAASLIWEYMCDGNILGNFKKNPRKGQYAYLLTPKGIREKSLLTHSFIERKREEFEALKAEIKALEAEAGLALEAAPLSRGGKQ